jgi:large subunit ribosomal protein L19
MDIIKSIEHEQLKNKIPVLNIGDTVKVHVRVKEGNRERIQVFEGIIIKKQGGGVNQTFTVRRISYGVGVEKTFLIHSPKVEKVEVTRVGKVRRAKLFYLRDRLGKSAKTKEKVGSRIETEEIVLKEELVEEIEEEVAAEVPVVEETPIVEEVKEEAVQAVDEKVKEEPAVQETDEKVEEDTSDNEKDKEKSNDTAPVESAPEEQPAITEENPVVEEAMDIVSEETVEVVKDTEKDTKKE